MTNSKSALPATISPASGRVFGSVNYTSGWFPGSPSVPSWPEAQHILPHGHGRARLICQPPTTPKAGASA